MLIIWREIRYQREKYKDHKYYQATIDFCENYDQGCFDPNYKSLPLEHFAPMVKRVFSRTPLVSKLYLHSQSYVLEFFYLFHT